MRLARVLIGLGVLSTLASPALAGVAAIETASPLADHSETAMAAAFTEAVETAVRGALAMGLPHVRLSRAFVLGDMLVIRLLVADAEAAAVAPDAQSSPDEASPDESPEAPENLSEQPPIRL